MTSRVAFSAADRGRRRRPLVVRSSTLVILKDPQLVVEVNDPGKLIHTARFVQGAKK